MKLHLKDLCCAFGKAEEAETISTEGVNPYLLEQVLWPALRGNAPELKDIDYDQFESEDLSELADYCERLEITSKKLEQFVGAVAGIEAVPCRSRQFC